MGNLSSVIDLVVNNDLCIGCGLCISQCPNNALGMDWNEFGFLEPKLIGICDCNASCVSVCPFNPFPSDQVKTENEISNIFLRDSLFKDSKIGRYTNLYVGYSEEFRLTSSSGGIATFILSYILNSGIVDSIFSVRESSVQGSQFEYSISKNSQDLAISSQTRYYPVTMSTVMSVIDNIEGKIAIVGVACFIKSIRLLQHKNPILKEKIHFLIGIICGGVKSKYFTEYLADKTGANKDFYSKPEYRIKDLNSTSSDYSFGCLNDVDSTTRTIRMQTVGDMWGTGLFKANACDFCDDVTTELADVSLGDAWFQPYINDGKGSNVIVTRSKLGEEIIQNGIKSSLLNVSEISYDVFISSQQGSFNHRQIGLPYRISLAKNHGKLVPPKRYMDSKNISFDFKLVQYLRILIRKKSLLVWYKKQNSTVFDSKMKYRKKLLRIATLFYRFRKEVIKNIR